MAGIIFSKSSNLQDSIYGKSEAPIKMFLQKRAEAYEQKSCIDEVFAIETSTNYAEKFTSMTAMDGFQPVGENGSYPRDHMQEGYSKIIEHVTWKDSFAISQEMIEDAKIIDLKQRPEQFISSYYRTREQFGACVLGNATQGNASVAFKGTSFDLKSADGQNLFSKTHPSKVKGGNQSNLFADSFSNQALAAGECAMQGFKGDNGEILDVTPDTIIIPNDYALKYAVFDAIGADKDPATANNGFNYNFGRWNVIVWPYLDAFVNAEKKPWLLLDQEYNKRNYGAVWLDRLALTIKNRVDDDTDAAVWSGRARFTCGFNDWRAIACFNVTGGTQLITG